MNASDVNVVWIRALECPRNLTVKLCADSRIFGPNRYNVRCRRLPLSKAWGDSVVRTDNPSVAEASPHAAGPVQ